MLNVCGQHKCSHDIKMLYVNRYNLYFTQNKLVFRIFVPRVFFIFFLYLGSSMLTKDNFLYTILDVAEVAVVEYLRGSSEICLLCLFYIPVSPPQCRKPGFSV